PWSLMPIRRVMKPQQRSSVDITHMTQPPPLWALSLSAWPIPGLCLGEGTARLDHLLDTTSS
ncbi:hypothetical protein STEG23_021313, partial [Scotinomys teguina]